MKTDLTSAIHWSLKGRKLETKSYLGPLIASLKSAQDDKEMLELLDDNLGALTHLRNSLLSKQNALPK